MKNRIILGALLTLFFGRQAWGQSESDTYFTATTEEGVEVSYCIPAGYGSYCCVSGVQQEGMWSPPAISTATKGSVTIPQEVYYNGNRYGVTHIDMNAFMNCTGLTEVSLPESVCSISMSAFDNCRSLKTIKLPKKVSFDYFWVSDDEKTFYIGENAFASCTALEEIELPEGTRELSQNVFYFCNSLKSVILPSTLTTIGEGAFAGCDALTSITVKAFTPPVLEDAGVFDSCSGATLYVPAGSKEDYAAADGWNKLSNIEEIAIDYQDGDTFYAKNDDGVRIAYKVLSADEKTCQVGDGDKAAIAQDFAGSVIVPAFANGFRVQVLGNYAFSDCNATQIELPPGINVIGNWVFVNCHQITRLTLPRDLTEIGWHAIEGCSQLEYLYWPAYITSRGLPTVGNCPSLARIETAENPYGDCNAVISGGSVELGCKTTIIPEGIIAIGAYAFYSCTGLTSVSLPRTLKFIGQNAFEDCTGLTDITLPEQVSRIEWEAFNCSSLKEVTVLAAAPATIYSNTFSNRLNATLYVPAGSKAAYEAADYWKEFKEIIEMEKEPTDTDVTDITALDNVIYIEPMEARAGTQATISLKMKNTAAIRGFQFDLCLPEGVTVVKSSKGKIQGALSADRLPDEDEHTLTFSEQSGNVIRFLCSSQYDETFTGSDGEIATLQVSIADDMEDGDYPVYMRNITLTETDISKFYSTDLVQSKLTIVSYVPGDINGDGKVDVLDYTGVANHIHGNTPAGFNAKAADVNEDGMIDVLDYTGIANIIHTGSAFGN